MILPQVHYSTVTLVLSEWICKRYLPIFKKFYSHPGCIKISFKSAIQKTECNCGITVEGRSGFRRVDEYERKRFFTT